MKFRLKKNDDAIELEQFLKAVNAEENYQKIRYMIKDGLISVNGEKVYARRKLLFIGDSVSFRDKYYTISVYKDNEPKDIIRRKMQGSEPEKRDKVDNNDDKIVHHKKPLSWSRKYDKKG